MSKKIMVYISSVIIIVIGIIMAMTIGFNMDFEYDNHTKIYLYMNDNSNLDEIESIIKETINTKYKIAYTDEFSDTISINIKEASEEEINNIKEKLKEKYNFEDIDKNVVVTQVAKVEVYNLVKDYIKPVSISFIIIMAYFAIAFRKLGIKEAFIEPLLKIVIINLIYVSILVIIRIPISIYTVPLGIFIYIMSLIGMALYLSIKNQQK